MHEVRAFCSGKPSSRASGFQTPYLWDGSFTPLALVYPILSLSQQGKVRLQWVSPASVAESMAGAGPRWAP